MTSLLTRVLRLCAVLLPAVALALLAAPAGADTPEGWPQEQDVDGLHAVLALGGGTLALILLILALVYVPALVRGERVAPGAPEVENQWLGGPRKEPHELTAGAAGGATGASETSGESGGASARW